VKGYSFPKLSMYICIVENDILSISHAKKKKKSIRMMEEFVKVGCILELDHSP